MKSENFLNQLQTQTMEDFEAQDPELFDTVFKIDGKKLYAHKYRLSQASTTFKAMLSDRWNSKNEPNEIKGYTFEDFKEFLAFIYSGECSINDENIFTILDLAEFYHINHLKDLCDTYLSKMKMNEGNIFKLMETSNKYSMEKMKKPLQAFVVSNFSTLVKCEHFLHADESVIEEFIKLQLKPEDIFQAVYEWSEYQAVKKQKESIDENFNLNDAIKAEIAPFLPKIQFKKMNLKFLHTFVVKRGFLFTYDELSDILNNANPDLKITITNSKGESIYGNVDPTSHAQTIDSIKSLKKRDFVIFNNHIVYWKTKCKIPTAPSSLYTKNGIKWYLIYFLNGNIGVVSDIAIRNNSLQGCLIAEMFGNDNFFGSKSCTIGFE